MATVNVAMAAVEQRAKLVPGEWTCRKQWTAGLTVATMNINSKGTMMRILAEQGAKKEYDIILLQEHHVADENILRDIAAQLAKWGWNSTWTPATAKAEGTTGGTGILWAQGLPMFAPVLQEGVAREGQQEELRTRR